ncbi:MAG: hypothetical protein KDA21_03565 [Phycisphaerales bacterium]|nr:hypothetical protein [Phycisphaerales bacterium]
MSRKQDQQFPLEAALVDARSRCDRLAAAIRNLRKEIERLTKKRDKARARAAALETESLALADRLTSIGGAIPDIVAIRSRMDGLKRNIHSLGDRAAGFEAQREDAARRREVAAADLRDTRSRVEGLKKLKQNHERTVQRAKLEAEDRETEDAARSARIRQSQARRPHATDSDPPGE